MTITEETKHIFNLFNWHTPPIEWTRINYDLNKKYKELGIDNLVNSKDIKNYARHFAGGALGNKFYGKEITNQLGKLKEKYDSKRDKDKPGLEYDTKIDFINNNRGINYFENNPSSTRKDIIDAAVKNAINNYAKDYTNNSLK